MPLNRGHRAFLGVLVALLLATAVGRAGEDDEKARCAQAYERAQELRIAHKLLDARQQLLVCSRPSCPKAAFDDCAAWLGDVEAVIPSVVVRVLDANGAPVHGPRVLVDGAPSDTAASGTAVILDPGPHTIRVEPQGHEAAESSLELHEGDRNHVVTFSIGATAPTSARPSGSRAPAIVAAAVGAVALASWGYFGIQGLVDRGSANGCLPHCPDDQVSRVNRELLVADVSLGVAVVSLAIAGWLWFSGRRAPAAAQSGLLVGTF